MQAAVLLEAPWREPATVMAALAGRPWSIGFISGGERARWSYVAADPEATLVLGTKDAGDPFESLAALNVPGEVVAGGPPFQGGVAGLLAYQLGGRIEAVELGRLGAWPDFACARYAGLLAFDHATRRVLAIGRGPHRAQARARAEGVLRWLELAAPAPLGWSTSLEPDDPAVYEQAVAEVVERICAGEIFQANVARRWRGELPAGAQPVDLLERLVADSPAPFATYLRLPGLALVANSPERFIQVWRDGDRLLARTEPIKGTAPRGATADDDRRLGERLRNSLKDRAENLMIVDLMRNDLARACRPGTVRTPELFQLATFANVHHLVSEVTGELAAGAGAADLIRAAFPPGSITGAPKVQAMKVIAELEAPRGPFFGSMFQLGCDGSLDSNVLIRTAAFEEGPWGWAVEARAGAGIVADSDPRAERLETEAKISALAAAFAGR